MILDEILANKARELAERRARTPLATVMERAGAAGPPRGFRAALTGPAIAVIAEVKRASPAKGDLRPDLDPASLAARYADAGAAAISVLTDERYFRGSDRDLEAVRAAVGLPLLRKDFVVDPYQVFEARALGADAVLLIVRALSADLLGELLEVTASLGMDALVEVHTAKELDAALRTRASLIGINNRDLTRMTVDLATTARLRPLVPSGITVVSESGIRTAADVGVLADLGVDAVLVGEALVTARDPGELLREMLSAAGRDGGAQVSAPGLTA